MFKLKPFILALTTILYSHMLCANTLNTEKGAKANIPFSNGAYLYAGSFDMSPGIAYWGQQIKDFNAIAKNKITSLYVYGSDIEFPCTTSTGVGGGAPGTPKFCNNKLLKFKRIGKQKIKSTVGFYYGSVALNGHPESGNKQIVANYAQLDHHANVTLIIDGRIDDGNIQGFNQLTKFQATALANLISFGGQQSAAYNPITKKWESNGSYVSGICSEKNITGVQIDLEPFNMKSKNGQVYFFKALSKNLSECHKNFSFFAFAESLKNTVAGKILNAHHNGYVIDSLYDLPSTTNSPVLIDQNGTPTYCTQVSDCKNKVPTSLLDYTGYVQAEVDQMLIYAVKNKVYFKFAIPAAASAHEFESWYKRGQLFVNKSVNPITPNKGYINKLINPYKTNGTTQLEYTKAAINAIKKGLKNNLKARQYFKGVVLWGFSPSMQWSPNPVVGDYESGEQYPKYIGGTTSGSTYVSFYPAFPPAAVLQYLKNNMLPSLSKDE